MAIRVTPITDADIPGVVTCIQRAFATDPYNNWVFNQRTFSLQRNSVSLSIRCKWGMSHALFHVAKDSSGKILGVACWLPPIPTNAPQTWSSWFGDWWLYFSQIRMNLFHGRGGLNTKRYWIWKAAQAEAQKGIWTDPEGYYFCNIVTVLPEAQGQGVGKLLFKTVTDLADAEGRRCYLESSRAEPNMRIYQRMGFELAKEMVCDDDGQSIKLYCMVREPRRLDTERS